MSGLVAPGLGATEALSEIRYMGISQNRGTILPILRVPLIRTPVTMVFWGRDWGPLFWATTKFVVQLADIHGMQAPAQ